MVTTIDEVRVGHWTNTVAATGCTVVILPEGTVASGEVRGGAPATREFALLDPTRMVQNVDAVVLAGGSAFGLASANGVMNWLETQNRGFQTSAGRVPIVVAMGLFDLAVGDASVRPDAAAGWAACAVASGEPVELGTVGAGTGATVSKWRGSEGVRPGGLVGAVRRHGDLVVAALLAVNALGGVDRGSAPGVEPVQLATAGWLDSVGESAPGVNTTIGLIVTNARLDKLGCHLAAQHGHHGLARSLLPSHTRFDGDALVAAATGTVEAGVDAVCALATTVVADAVRSLHSP